MSNIAAANITTTLLNQRRNNGRSYFNVQLAFGNGTLTYPAGGVPTTAATFGMINTVESCNVYDTGGSGYQWTYRRASGKLQCFESRALDWATLAGVTSSWVANTTVTAQYRVLGDTAEVQVNLALAGAPTSAALNVTMPAALTVDTTKLVSANADAQLVGTGGSKHSSTNSLFVVAANITAAQQFDVYFDSSVTTAALTAVDATHTQTWANGDEVNLRFSFPVTGFGGGQSNGLYEPAAVAIAAQTLKCEVVGW